MTINQFQRTRNDHRRERAEDYVELVDDLIREVGEARVTELASRLGISHVTVSRTVQRLVKEGYLTSQPYRSIFLTPLGAEMAQQMRERHALILKFLRKLGVPDSHAEADAEGIEHHVSEQTLDAIRRFVETE